ncbi:MAG TPA: cellulase family glycosylhydrolase [Acidimicrobiales bacterium]|nr:cellulase family glycosylhydrolase [Acidimicrobiales bacterium]
MAMASIALSAATVLLGRTPALAGPQTPGSPPVPDVGGVQASTPAAIAAQASVVGSPWDPQSMAAPGGRYLRDSFGRVVTLHGVNAVYKHAPYELAVAPGQAFDFSAADAAAIAGAGFNMVRLGILWEGLEPGGAPNAPAVCAPGAPREPGRFSTATADAYLDRVVGVVDLLGRFHIHTLLDMHQDVYAEAFRGEGAPPWAVCTDGQPIQVLPDRWSRNYASASLNIAERHFWQNNVVGNLQGQFDQVWATVASTFRDNPWVVGYDPYNEPFSRGAALVAGSDPASYVATDLECFYTGRLHPGLAPGTHTPVSCPATDPALGVVPTIEAADPNHLVFVEPDIYYDHGAPDTLGPMPFPRLVYNVHVYCSHRNPVTGAPASPPACAAQALRQLAVRAGQRDLLSTPEQPGGPPMFLSEFGATGDPAVLQSVTTGAAQMQIGWAYWSWKYYNDPTGSSDEPLATSDGRLLPQITTLATPYAEAIAGRPTRTSYDPATRIFALAYLADPAVDAPSVVITAPARYPDGYCATASGATIESAPGASHLLLENDPAAGPVTFRLAPGPCPASPGTS